ncbi:hypothetical protein FRC02_003252 [Tulasnella sp. 418]|nr:hypothetical protein FRC02_003252 [Tulasnella sp. 418]
MGPDVSAPRAVYEEYWEQVCPPERRTHLKVSQVHQELGLDNGSEGSDIMGGWVDKISKMPDNCIEIDDAHIFDYGTIGTPPILSVWPELAKSPILKKFSWSPLVLNAVARNLPRIMGVSASQIPKHLDTASTTVAPHDSMILGLVAIHLRRGDYDQHCEFLAKWGARFTGWNQFPEYHDMFVPPKGADGTTTPENLATYMKRCWPTKEQVIAKLDAVRQETVGGERLERVFILTNGDDEWVKDMKSALKGAGWKGVTTSKDIKLKKAEIEVDGAVDMQIAARAEVFVGNGVS